MGVFQAPFELIEKNQNERPELRLLKNCWVSVLDLKEDGGEYVLKRDWFLESGDSIEIWNPKAFVGFNVLSGNDDRSGEIVINCLSIRPEDSVDIFSHSKDLAVFFKERVARFMKLDSLDILLYNKIDYVDVKINLYSPFSIPHLFVLDSERSILEKDSKAHRGFQDEELSFYIAIDGSESVYRNQPKSSYYSESRPYYKIEINSSEKEKNVSDFIKQKVFKLIYQGNQKAFRHRKGVLAFNPIIVFKRPLQKFLESILQITNQSKNDFAGMDLKSSQYLLDEILEKHKSLLEGLVFKDNFVSKPIYLSTVKL